MNSQLITNQMDKVVKTAMIDAYRMTEDRAFAYMHGMTALTVYLKEIGVAKVDARRIMDNVFTMIEESDII